MPIETGLTHEMKVAVTEDLTAEHYGNPGFPVLATPALCGLAERCCIAALAPHLESGQGSVGTSLSIEHLAATPPGFTVTLRCTLQAVERSMLDFVVEATDGVDTIARITHRRAVVGMERFRQRVEAKAARAAA
ncbi:thioesterase family protein [Roseomonas indoligenes]|uniref:Thioesterase family protein n=1 Tax=Roseomonas indoligenes TaxID=2820811 RepID=A0A940N0L4_9PROT|nr:thioesterase family protein [Pararoseomonas indoligenes]MBP0495068.1 thioesterase family protein [Pararoseomonas indoligenes]